MAENDQQVHPMPPPTSYNPHTKHDEESATATAAAVAAVQSEELRRQKRKKLIIYIAAFVIFQIAVITAFSLTVMKVKTPKFRVRSATFESFDVQNSTANVPSFNLMLDAQLGVKNSNFGPYKYEDSSVSFFYKDTLVGSAVVSKSKAKMLSTKKFNVKVPVTGAGISGLADDLKSGILPLTSQAKLQGKVTLMLVMKKKKSSQMDCTMELNTNTRQLQNIKCK